MLTFFKNKNPLFLLLIPALSVLLLYLWQQLAVPVSAGEPQSFLSKLLFPILPAKTNSSLAPVLKFIFLNVFVLFSLYFINSGRFVLSNNFLYGFIVFFILAIMTNHARFAEAVILNGLLIGSLFFLIQASEKTPAPFPYFNAAFFISLASLFNPKFIFFLLLLPAAIIIFRQGSFKELWASLLGVFLPYWLLLGLHFFFKGSWTPEPNLFYDITETKIINFRTLKAETPALIYLLLFILISSSFVYTKFRSLNTDHRLHFILFFFSFILSMAIIIFNAEQWYMLWPLVAFLTGIPISFYLNNSSRKLLPEILFLLFLLFIIYSHISVNFNLFL
jgi:hypothetical protein